MIKDHKMALVSHAPPCYAHSDIIIRAHRIQVDLISDLFSTSIPHINTDLSTVAHLNMPQAGTNYLDQQYTGQYTHTTMALSTNSEDEETIVFLL